MIDYKLVENASGEQGIQICEGKYTGVVYTYGEVQLLPVKEGEQPQINFTRAVRACPDELRDSISEDNEFNQIMGDILVELLEEEGEKAVELLKDDKKSEQT